MKPTIYLDIDGVLIANENNASLYADEFLVYVLNSYPSKWLTTHVMDGNANTAIEHIGHLFKPSTVELMHKIAGTSWSFLKTEAIDFSNPFLWLDDDLYPEEKEVLLSHNALGNFVDINLFENQNQLKDLLNDFPRAVMPTPIAPKSLK